ncbi:hypothetical protein F4814DRAFT_401950 [Daldinia grandis]|nr:hypothetical protein F4814DRAFT_401950 [Daldinia grandis]
MIIMRQVALFLHSLTLFLLPPYQVNIRLPAPSISMSCRTLMSRWWRGGGGLEFVHILWRAWQRAITLLPLRSIATARFTSVCSHRVSSTVDDGTYTRSSLIPSSLINDNCERDSIAMI